MCQPLWFLCLARCMGSRQAPFSSFSFTGMLGPHCAAQFGKEEQGPWQHCFLRLHFLATALAGFHGTGDKVLCLLPQSRLGHGYGSEAKTSEGRGRILLQWELTRISRRKQAGRVWNPKDSIFYTLINFSIFLLLFKVKKMFPKILNFDCKDLLQRMWELPYFLLPSAVENLCATFLLEASVAAGICRVADALNTFSVLVVLLVKSRWLCCLRSRYNCLYLRKEYLCYFAGLVPCVIAVLFCFTLLDNV